MTVVSGIRIVGGLNGYHQPFTCHPDLIIKFLQRKSRQSEVSVSIRDPETKVGLKFLLQLLCPASRSAIDMTEPSTNFCRCSRCRKHGPGKLHPITQKKIAGDFVDRRAYQRHQESEALRKDKQEASTLRQAEEVLIKTAISAPKSPVYPASLGVRKSDLVEPDIDADEMPHAVGSGVMSPDWLNMESITD